MHARTLMLLTTTLCVGCSAPAPADVQLRPAAQRTRAITQQARDALAEAVEVYDARRAEAWLNATDVEERLETMFSEGSYEYFANSGAFETLFFFGDEAFEAERDRYAGFGRVTSSPLAAAASVQRIHDGERGGLDSSSCRSCHFNGGPDGAGNATQVALLRGDGVHLSSSTLRDAPHVMGLGYIEMIARDIELELEIQVDIHRIQASFSTDDPYVGPLQALGIDFGAVLIFQDGAEDYGFVRGISPDLKVRPFGHKGRHRFLTDVADEAFAVHHAHQSTAREARYTSAWVDDEPQEDIDARQHAYLGDGEAGDRDADGVVDELSTGQGSLLATYMSLLGTPTMRPPADPAMALVWAEGRALFDDVGCTACHVESLRLQTTDLFVQSFDGRHPATWVPLLDEGQEPKPSRNDFSADALGIPLFAFTDLRRHDMGDSLADDVDEELPDGAGAVPRRQWLTRSLWGLADTAPYLHDGRAPTVHDAIVAHDGEARDARDAYVNLDDDEQGAVRVFLHGLGREPVMMVE